MIGKLSPEDRVMDYKTEIYSQVANVIKELGWNDNDNIAVEVGGALTSAIHQKEGVNPKWSKPFGTTTYQNDAFTVKILKQQLSVGRIIHFAILRIRLLIQQLERSGCTIFR